MTGETPARDPFAPQADPALYVPRPETERALRELEAGVHTISRAVTLSGPIGIGKTLLLRVLERRLRASLPCFFFAYPALSAEDLCRTMLVELDVEPTDAPEVVLLEWLRRHAPSGRVVLIIDDADAMPRETALALGTLASATGGSLRLVLAASEGPDAEGVFAAVGDGRVDVRLARPMTAEETAVYVTARLGATGAAPDLQARFDARTLQRLHEESEGLPARLHALADSWVLGGAAAEGATEGTPERGETRPSEAAAASEAPSPSPEAPHSEEPTPRGVRQAPADPEPAPAPAAVQEAREAAAPPPAAEPARGPRVARGLLVAAAIVAAVLVVPRMWRLLGEDPAPAPATVAPPAPERAAAPALTEMEASVEPSPETIETGIAPVPASEPIEEVPSEIAESLVTASDPPPALEEVPSAEDSEEIPAVAEAESDGRAAGDEVAVASGTEAEIIEPASEIEAQPEMQPEPEPAQAAEPLAVARAVPGQAARESAAVAPEAPAAPSPLDEPERAPAAPTPPRVEPAPELGLSEPEAVPAPPPIQVNINATPWASIQVDGRDLGYTPLADVPLAPGPHRFRAELPDGRVVEREIEIDAANRHLAFE